MPGRQLLRTLSALALLALVLAGWPQPALASQRTFVATSGSDANPCSRSLPCRTFGAALAQTDPGGEIVALDSGGYGAVTITKAVTIVGAPGEHVAITTSSGDAIDVAAGASDRVVLRNLYLNGIGADNGIHFTSGAALHVEHVVVNGFSNGIFVNTAADSETFISDTIARNNGIGVDIFAGSGATATALITRTSADGNGAAGVSAGDGSRVVVRDSVAAGSSLYGFTASAPTMGATAQMSIEHCTASGNIFGVAAFGTNGGSAVIDVSNSTITYNGTGVFTSGTASIFSRVNNTLERNGADGSFTGTIAAK